MSTALYPLHTHQFIGLLLTTPESVARNAVLIGNGCRRSDLAVTGPFGEALGITQIYIDGLLHRPDSEYRIARDPRRPRWCCSENLSTFGTSSVKN